MKTKITWSFYRHATVNPTGMSSTWICKINDKYEGQIMKADSGYKFAAYIPKSSKSVLVDNLRMAVRYIVFGEEPKPEPPPIVEQPKQEQVRQNRKIPARDDEDDYGCYYG